MRAIVRHSLWASWFAATSALLNVILFALYLGGGLAALAFWPLAGFQAFPLLVFAGLAALMGTRARLPSVSATLNFGGSLLCVVALAQSLGTFWFRQHQTSPELSEPNVTWLVGPIRVSQLGFAILTLALIQWAIGHSRGQHARPSA